MKKKAKTMYLFELRILVSVFWGFFSFFFFFSTWTVKSYEFTVHETKITVHIL